MLVRRKAAAGGKHRHGAIRQTANSDWFRTPPVAIVFDSSKTLFCAVENGVAVLDGGRGVANSRAEATSPAEASTRCPPAGSRLVSRAIAGFRRQVRDGLRLMEAEASAGHRGPMGRETARPRDMNITNKGPEVLQHSRRTSCLVLLLCAHLCGCGGATRDDDLAQSTATYSGKYPIRVVCTTGMVADMLAAVGGDRLHVERLMGEGVDPHLYEPTMADNMKLSKADLVFYNGLHLEPGMHEVFVVMSRRKPVYAVGDYLKSAASERLIALDGGFYDPHIWFDPDMWADCIPGVVESLSRFDPANAGHYQEKGDEYQRQVRELSAYGREKISEIPPPRYLITAHDAFSYFGRAFDMRVEAIQGVSTDAEASVGRFSELVELMVRHQVRAVFSESSINKKTVEALLEGCRARGHEVQLGGELYSDALGPEDSPAGTYLGMVRHNIDTITRALK